VNFLPGARAIPAGECRRRAPVQAPPRYARKARHCEPAAT
jgi:hypothetical protein